MKCDWLVIYIFKVSPLNDSMCITLSLSEICVCRKGRAAYLSFLNVELINDMCALLFLIFIMNASQGCHGVHFDK